MPPSSGLPLSSFAIPPEPVEKGEEKKLRSLIDYIYEPSSDEIVSALVPKHLNFQMWRVLLESNAAEQGARMTAMENASTNAKEMISSLELSYNKARPGIVHEGTAGNCQRRRSVEKSKLM